MYQQHDSDFLILGALLMVPAIIVFAVLTFFRVRRNRFRRQRIKGHRHHSDEKKK